MPFLVAWKHPAISSAARPNRLKGRMRRRAAMYEAYWALWEAMFSNAREGRQRAESALEHSTGRDVGYPAALALAFAGDTVRAKTLADDLAKRFPEDTLVQFNYLPSINAKLALSRKDSAKAVEVVQHAASYELGDIDENPFYPIYVRGEAYLAAQQGRQAASEFQKTLHHRTIVRNSPLGALTHLQLARAYVMQGDTAKAEGAYKDFLALVERCRPRHPYLERNQGGVREVTVAKAPDVAVAVSYHSRLY